MMGMMSQSASLNNIGTNIANVSTGGFKRTDMGFATVLSKTIQNTSDLGGVQPITSQRIDLGGNIISSSRNLDAAISGQGFFVLNTEINGSGDTFYSRDGSFTTVTGDDITVTADDGVSTITTQEAYLVDKNGLYVMGWQPQADGTFNTSGSMSAMRVDAYAFQDNAIATTEASLDLNLPANDDAGSEHLYNIQVFDSTGAEHSITLNFTKDATNNSWTVTPTYYDAATAQVDTIALGGSVEAGDLYSVTVAGTTINYSATGAEASMSVIRDNLLALINANPTITSNVTAAASGTSSITLTANTAGTGFTTLASTTQGLADEAQVDTVTLGGTFEAGDVFTVTIDGTAVNYTAVGGDIDLDGVATSLAAAINGAALGVTAAAIGGNQLTLTADTAGTAFTSATGAVDGGGTDDQTVGGITTTANFAALADNTNVATTTTPNDTGLQTGTATTLTFNGDAELVSPTELAITASWTGDGTVSTTLDISSMTQYAGDFMPFNYTQNGFGTGQLREISFDTQGHIQGQFTNTRARALYRIGLGVFANPNGLEMISGNLFKESALSGSARITAPDTNSYGSISGNALEMSNVDVADEFTRMIITQQAYSSSATVFKTVDEMTTVARDLKR
jgi:flagellar hook protein FlgE